jgi:cytoskeletal protein RodZ
MGHEPDPPDIPASLKRDSNNRAEYMHMSEDLFENEVEAPVERPEKPKAKAKANGPTKARTAKAAKAPVKAKTAPKATARSAKAPAKAKAGKAKATVTEKDQYGLRKGSTKSLAAAMYARKSGATLTEVKDKLGSVQLNVLVALETEGYKVEREKEERKGARPVTRYRLFPKEK